MPVIANTQQQAVGAPPRSRLRTAAVVAAIVAAFALAALLVVAIGDDGAPAGGTAQPAAVEQSTISQPGIRYDGGPEEGSWSAAAPNPGRPDGGPEEGTRGARH